MKSKTPSFLPVAAAALLLGGCSLGPVSAGSEAYLGWSGARIDRTISGNDGARAAGERPMTGSTKSSDSANPSGTYQPSLLPGTEGICHVQAPNINPSTRRNEIVVPLGQRALSTENDVPDGFVVKETICSDTIDPELVLEVAYRLRERGYAVPFGSSSSTQVVERTFELFKRDNGFYGDGFTLDALSHLGVDPLEWVKPRTVVPPSGFVAAGWAEAGH